MKNFISLIPLRKGSKGIKNKNLRLINGEPLYIRAIKQAERVTKKCIVNTDIDEILNKKCYKEINDIKDDIDIVDVFRPSEDVLPFVKDAIKKNPKVIWLQEGIHNEEAENLAREHGIDVVFNRCMLAEHQRLM